MKFGYAILVATSTVLVSGCSEKESFQRNDQPSAERDDQVAITTRDGNVVLALTGANTVSMRLSDSLRSSVNSEIAREFSKDSAESRFGRWVQRTTANLVEKGMAFEFSIPVEDIESVSHDDGAIRFEYRKGRKFKFESVKKDGRSAMEFDPDDAERFVDAVRKASHRSS